MKCQTVIFDMGGVLLDFDFDICIQSFREIGFSRIDEMIDRYRQRGPFFEIEAGLISESLFFETIRRIIGKPLSDQRIAETWCRFLKGIPRDSLEYVRNIRQRKKTYLLSNSNPIHWGWVCRRYFPTENERKEFFDDCFLSFEMKMCKPDPEIYEAVTRRVETDPSRILFIDDSEENCSAAEKIGWKTVCPKTAEEWKRFLDCVQ